jgi:hypothetical protein
MHMNMKKILVGAMMVFAFGASMAQSLDIDLTSTADIASGAYDLDAQYLGRSFYGSGNVAGIYQQQTDDVDLGNVAEIQQIDGVTNLAMIWQQGFNHEAHIIQNGGENNVARLAQVGTGHYASLTQTGGSDNVMFVHMLGDNARIVASQVDAISNVLSVVLNTGSQLTVTQSGEGNRFSTVLAPNTIMFVNQTGQ